MYCLYLFIFFPEKEHKRSFFTKDFNIDAVVENTKFYCKMETGSIVKRFHIVSEGRKIKFY